MDVKVIFERQVNKKTELTFLEGWYIIAHNDLQSLVRPECDGTSEGEGGALTQFLFVGLPQVIFMAILSSQGDLWQSTANPVSPWAIS